MSDGAPMTHRIAELERGGKEGKGAEEQRKKGAHAFCAQLATRSPGISKLSSFRSEKVFDPRGAIFYTDDCWTRWVQEIRRSSGGMRDNVPDTFVSRHLFVGSLQYQRNGT